MLDNDRRTPPAAAPPATVRPLPVIAAGSAVFTVLLVLVLSRWTPLRELDRIVSLELNEMVAASSAAAAVLRVVTDLADPLVTAAVLAVLTVVLLIRRLPRLALWVAVTGAGLAVLDPLAKSLVGRQRPVLPVVVQTASGESFPSGHALASFTTIAILLLIALPLVPARRRIWAYLTAATLIVAVGFTRVALGVHYVSDVIAGWALAATWTATTALVLRAQLHGTQSSPLRVGVEPDSGPALRPAPDNDEPVLARPGRTAVVLVTGLAAITTVIGGFGLLVTQVLRDTWLSRFDQAAVDALTGLVVPDVDAPAAFFNAIGGTRVIIVVALTSGVFAVAILRSWRPALFLAVALAGEVAVYLVVSRLIVSRPRPWPATMGDLPDLASFPSGHAAAAMTLYGAIALLAFSHVHGRWRVVALAIPALVGLLVAVSRLYRGVHYPTDVLASALIAIAWLTLTYRLLLHRGGRSGTDKPRQVEDPLSSERAATGSRAPR